MSNAVVFIQSDVGDIQANLLAVKDAANAKKTEDLFCFSSDNKKRNKILLEVTDFI